MDTANPPTPPPAAEDEDARWTHPTASELRAVQALAARCARRLTAND